MRKPQNIYSVYDGLFWYRYRMCSYVLCILRLDIYYWNGILLESFSYEIEMWHLPMQSDRLNITIESIQWFMNYNNHYMHLFRRKTEQLLNFTKSQLESLLKKIIHLQNFINRTVTTTLLSCVLMSANEVIPVVWIGFVVGSIQLLNCQVLRMFDSGLNWVSLSVKHWQPMYQHDTLPMLTFTVISQKSSSKPVRSLTHKHSA